VTGGTLIALTGRFRIIKATLDDLYGLTRGSLDAVWPAQLADGLIALHIIDQILDIDLHRRTPVRVREMGFISLPHPQIPRPWNPIWPLNRTCLRDVFDLISDKPYRFGKLFGSTVEFYDQWYFYLDRCFENNYVLLRKDVDFRIIEPVMHFDHSNAVSFE
jgi:hypothetical protein